jgi:hypothetical protein
VTGAAADVGHGSAAVEAGGGEAGQDLTIERLAVELVGELVRVFAGRDVVAGGDVARRREVGHRPIVADEPSRRQ